MDDDLINRLRGILSDRRIISFFHPPPLAAAALAFLLLVPPIVALLVKHHQVWGEPLPWGRFSFERVEAIEPDLVRALPPASIKPYLGIVAVKVLRDGRQLEYEEVKRPAELKQNRFTSLDGVIYAKGIDTDKQRFEILGPLPIPWVMQGVLDVLAVGSLVVPGLLVFLSPTPWERQVGIACFVGMVTITTLVVYSVAAFNYQSRHPASYSSLKDGLIQRVNYFNEHPADFDLIFMGDSRTYCGMHPDLFDPIAGSHSINLSSFSNWLPTQFSVFEDIIDQIPNRTTVVWSVGHQNFDFSPIARVYPISIPNAVKLVLLGVSPHTVADAVAWGFSWSHLFLYRANVRSESLEKTLHAFSKDTSDADSKRNAISAPGQANTRASRTLTAEIDRIRGKYLSEAGVANVYVNVDDDRITSATLIRTGGSYYRIEFDHAYFRRKQIEGLVDLPQNRAAWRPNPTNLRIFDEMLAMMSDRGINVVVNEMEEAPHRYRSPAEKAAFRHFMQTTIRPRVEARGFAYVGVDFDRFTDADYFDFNHFNSQGIEKYLPMLKAVLAPYIKKSKAP